MSRLPPAAEGYTEGLRRESDTASIAIAGVVYLASVVALLLSAMTVPVGTDLLKLTPTTARLIFFALGTLSLVYWHRSYSDSWFARGYKIDSIASSSNLGNLLGILAAVLTTIGTFGFVAGIAVLLSVGHAAPTTFLWLLPIVFGLASYALWAQYAEATRFQGLITGLQVIVYMLPVTLLLFDGRQTLHFIFSMLGLHR